MQSKRRTHTCIHLRRTHLNAVDLLRIVSPTLARCIRSLHSLSASTSKHRTHMFSVWIANFSISFWSLSCPSAVIDWKRTYKKIKEQYHGAPFTNNLIFEEHFSVKFQSQQISSIEEQLFINDINTVSVKIMELSKM